MGKSKWNVVIEASDHQSGDGLTVEAETEEEARTLALVKQVEMTGLYAWDIMSVTKVS